MKIITVLTFAVFLGTFAIWIRPLVSPDTRVLALMLVGFSPAFWTYRDFISSEFPYLMFSFLALLAIQRATPGLGPHEWRFAWALLIAALLYACYATRTIGIALPIALACKELAERKRVTRFLILTSAILAVLISLQTALLTSPSGYISVVRISVGSVLSNLWSYAKSITFAWQNGFSQIAQGLLGLSLTACAAFAFIRRNRNRAPIEAWYLLAYMAILITWGTQIGIRGLLPILPIYLTYVLLGISDVAARLRSTPARIFMAAVGFCIVAAYIGSLRQPIRSVTAADVNDASAQELFTFLRTQTTPSDLLVFSKPRTISLFTSRIVTSLGPDETPADSARFLRSVGAQFLIQSPWNPPAYRHLIETEGAAMTEVFRNRDFQVLRLNNKNGTENLATQGMHIVPRPESSQSTPDSEALNRNSGVDEAHPGQNTSTLNAGQSKKNVIHPSVRLLSSTPPSHSESIPSRPPNSSSRSEHPARACPASAGSDNTRRAAPPAPSRR